jgi:hypothetical protein
MQTAKVKVNGNTKKALTIQFSVLTYACNVLYNDKSKATLIELVKALYKYNAAAKTYFATVNS